MFFWVLTELGAQDLEEAIKPDRPIQLFNGKDLSNFYTWLVDSKTEDPDRVFMVVDQVDGSPAIRISGQHWGGIITQQSYRDYHLIVEFRWGLETWGSRTQRTRDSGILVHCQGPDGNTGSDMNGPWMRSLEAQIIQGGVGDIILVAGHDASGQRITPRLKANVKNDRDGEPVYASDGEVREFRGGRINWFGRDPDWVDILDFRGSRDVESPVGEWTRLEVICDGDTITNIVNGRVVNRGFDADLTSGKILIQSEAAEIYIRRVEVRPVP
jgi:hypothetical protein